MDAFGDGPVGRAVALATSSAFGVGGARFHYSTREQFVDTGFLGAWRREVFERFGLFDEELVRNQDDEFNYRIRKGGGRILLPVGVSVRYRCRSTLASLGRQYFQYGYWKVRVLQKHPWQMRPRQFAPPALVLTLVLPLVLGAFVHPALWLAPMALAAYLIGNLAACASLAGRARGGTLALLPVTFAVLHLSYGLGFWVGFARFWNRWDRRRARSAAGEVMGAA
jgi:GT2 family glycosyltransferase